ncbi:hypothetical protein [Neorhizobium sp. NCHU2750]|uniref:hypothetical protein n=1 Tax=Neorhizobium sp. NCHU2750 TaxID=1825976 RepID=UPI000E731020|nr:hypothetical protein NCHU2750_11920 [Neorhizobium sp. NCHU2750]
MSFIRRIALSAALLGLCWGAVDLPQAEAQQKAALAQPNISETAFRTWLASLEKSGAKLGPVQTRYEASTDTLDAEGISLSWPQSAASGGLATSLEFSIRHLSVKSFRSNNGGISFEAVTAQDVVIAPAGAVQGQVHIGELLLGGGQLPSLAGFVADPTKPFTTQVRLVRLLTSAKVANASAKKLELPSGVQIASTSLDAFAAGKAKLLKIEGLVFARAPSEASPGQSGKLAVESVAVADIDFDPYLRLFEPSAYLDNGSARPWANMIGSITLAGLKAESGPFSTSIRQANAGPVKVKQFDEDLSGIFNRAASDPQYLSANPLNAAKIASAIRNAFAIDTVSTEDVTISGQNQSGAITAHLAQAAIQNLTADSIKKMTAGDLAIKDPTGEFKLSSVDLGDINLVPVTPDDGKTARTAGVTTAIVPAIGSIKADGLSLKLQDTAASLDSLDVSMAYFIGATPTNVQLKLGHLKFETAQISNPPLKQALTDLGYPTVDLSVNLSGNWDDTSGSVLLDDLTIAGADMGTLSLSGAFSGISRGGLQAPATVLPTELAKAGIKNFRLTFENASLFDRYVAKVAQANGRSVDDIKKTLSANIPNIFAGINPAGLRNKFIFAAIGFLNAPQMLILGAAPENTVSFQEVAAAMQTPSNLPALLNIDVSANNRRQ